jgi:hypothetical protein
MPLKIEIPEREFFDEEKSQFINVQRTTLTMEHSLVSISKWESKWHIPYLSDKPKTKEQTIDYLRCMTITQNVDPFLFNCIPDRELLKIKDYIENPMTATTFAKEEGKGHTKKILTSEVLYYYMIAFNIPVEFEKWHLNRLLTLIKVCSEENKPKKKIGSKQLANKYASLNAARRAKLKSKG